MLTGVATPYVHNGIMEPEPYDDQNYDVSPHLVNWSRHVIVLLQFGNGKTGIVSRNEMGFLLWSKDEVTRDNHT